MEIGIDGGWTDSAPAWIRGMRAQDDRNRTVLLDPVMLDLCGDVTAQLVLDDGCGEGRFSRMLADRGARVVGLDLIAAMTQAAHEAAQANERYVTGAGESLPFADAVFDLVVSYVVLVDIPDFRAAIAETARVLKPGGRLLVANLGFVTASDGWLKDEHGQRLYHRVDRYLEERSQVYEWGGGIRIRNWHRPLSAYMDAYLSAGLTLRRFIEPVPADDSYRANPETEDWYRVPDFTVMLWEAT
jgi:SAM-dependent methyltransferase